MSIVVEKKEKNFVNLNMSVDAKTVTDEYNKACKRIAQRVNIAGFRKGKAPRNILEKHVGVNAIKQEALDAILPKMISQAISENSLDVISEPSLTNLKYNIGEDLTATVVLELRPEVELGEYKNQTIDVEEFVQDEDFVKKELEYIQNRFATFEPVVGRKTTDKDIVVFDFDGTCNGEKIKGGSSKNYNLDLANSNFIPGFAEQLVGHDISEEFTIDVTFPENYHDETLKGQPAQFAIKINEIKEKKVPELNDEVAQKAGNYKNVDEMKADIEKYAEEIKKTENEKKALDAIFNKLLDEVKVELSDTMINREQNAMLQDMKSRITMQGGDFDKMLEAEGKDKILGELKDEAIKRIKNSLVVQKIATLEQINVMPDDLNQKVEQIAKQYNADKNTVMQQLFSSRQAISSLGQQVIGEKVAKFLLDNNSINFVKSKK